MTATMRSDVYYDPYDEAIYADPYLAFRRLREEAPLSYNETYDFWALSRFHDVEAGFADHATFSSAHGGDADAVPRLGGRPGERRARPHRDPGVEDASPLARASQVASDASLPFTARRSRRRRAAGRP